MVFDPSMNVGEVILPGEQTEKSDGEQAGQGQMSAVFRAGIGYLIENFGKMGKIVVHNKPP